MLTSRYSQKAYPLDNPVALSLTRLNAFSGPNDINSSFTCKWWGRCKTGAGSRHGWLGVNRGNGHESEFRECFHPYLIGITRNTPSLKTRKRVWASLMQNSDSSGTAKNLLSVTFACNSPLSAENIAWSFKIHVSFIFLFYWYLYSSVKPCIRIGSNFRNFCSALSFPDVIQSRIWQISTPSKSMERVSDVFRDLFSQKAW